jgi:hypothetical protein
VGAEAASGLVRGRPDTLLMWVSDLPPPLTSVCLDDLSTSSAELLPSAVGVVFFWAATLRKICRARAARPKARVIIKAVTKH